MNAGTDSSLAAAALEAEVYGLGRQAKREWLLDGLQSLTRHHHLSCPPYRAMLDALWRGGQALPSRGSSSMRKPHARRPAP